MGYSDVPLLNSAAGPTGRQRLFVALFLIVAVGVLWTSLWDHPLSPRSEGRYASVSWDMAVHGHYLVPQLNGQPHLTKPPLIYWLEAACLRWLGHGELAVRIPSAAAGSLIVITLMAVGWKLYGWRVAVLATAVLSLMPMHVIISRLTLTDSLLALWWWLTLAGGVLTIRQIPRPGEGDEPRAGDRDWRWPALMWFAVAMGLLTKGPLAWVPVGLVLLWLVLAGRGRDIRALRLGWGLPLSAMPLAGWVGAILWLDPQAVAIWYREMVSRAVGQGDHPEPIWFFLPIFVVGLFPATGMLNLPGLNFPWRQAWQWLRRGEEVCLWALAVVVPLVMFSLIKGKLPSYLAPLAPPLAILTGLMLERWVTGRADRGEPWRREPEVVGAIGVIAIGAAVVLAGLMWLPQPWITGLVGPWDALHAHLIVLWRLRQSIGWAPIPCCLLAVATGWLWWNWKRRPERRGWGLALVWAAAIVCWYAAFEIEDQLSIPTSNPRLLVAVHQQMDPVHPQIVLYGFTDATFTFYHQHATPRVNPDELAQQRTLLGSRLVVLAQLDDWTKLQKAQPALAAKFVDVMVWERWPLGKRVLVLRGRE